MSNDESNLQRSSKLKDDLMKVGSEISNGTSINEAKPQITRESLVERVFAELGPRKRDKVSRDLVEASISTLELDSKRNKAVPRLRVERLIFGGEKTLNEKEMTSFVYDQSFVPGVNIVLIEKNHAGKSTILKTISYALTGDDSDYEVDVRDWINRIWLYFSLDEAKFTIHINRSEGKVAGYISAGVEDRGIGSVAEMPLLIEQMTGTEQIKDALNTFFLKRFGLASLGWTSKISNGSEVRHASWRTFFQALRIPDSSENYLICDSSHSFGGQDNIIMSEFLGLSFSEALNQLLISRQTATKKNDASEEQVKKAQADAEIVKQEIQNATRELKTIATDVIARQQAVQTNEAVLKLNELQSSAAEKSAELRHIKEERERVNKDVRNARARAQRVREAVEIQRHFTSLEVRKCPRCTIDVDMESVERENVEHLCRVCGKEAPAATHADAESMLAEATAIDDQVGAYIAQREQFSAIIRNLEAEFSQISKEAGLLESAAREGVSFAFPTPDEQNKQAELQERIGGLRHQYSLLTSLANQNTTIGQEANLEAEVHEVIRKTLRNVAEEANHDVLTTLGTLTQEMTRTFGATSITDVTCSSVGKLMLKKNGETVPFKSIHNPGEKLRMKLAFFIALMRLGRLTGGASTGRHPGFLLIDQPASAEMVVEHVTKVADALRELDETLSDQLQIICFTTDSAFAQATASNKIYGALAPPYAF